MKKNLIARDREWEELQNCVDSNESEFVIICGRRRIGKTYLVEEFFDDKYDFRFVGGHNIRTRIQLNNFAKSLSAYSEKKISGTELKNWSDAFYALQEYLETLPSNKRKVIFIDEMPWLDTQRSDFVSSLEYFWNAWANRRRDIVLVATGSATSWMTDKLIKNRGGLHNRIRHRIYLRPFNLKETEEYLSSIGVYWDRYQILQSYMLTGGVPFYLKMLDGHQSAAQTIDKLCFDANGPLRYEFDELYHAIFPKAESYIDVVKALANNKSGLTRTEIMNITGLSGSFLTRVITNLEKCNFIDKFSIFGKKNDTVYRLIDFYTLFYFKFLENDTAKDEDWWTHHLDSSSIYSWMGITFETICMLHHKQIKKTLGISGMATEVSTWRCAADEEEGTSGAQIDMIIDRADRIIHLCEMKFSETTYNVTKAYEMKLRERAAIFKLRTDTTKSLVHTFVTTFGVTDGKHKSIVHSEVTMDDLFNS